MPELPKEQFHPFFISVKIDGTFRRFHVIQILKGIGEDQYKLTARNKSLVFSTNKPIIERRSLKDFPWTWKLIEGELYNKYALDAIIAALEQQLRGGGNPAADCTLHNFPTIKSFR
ncbi:MAG: hypothetical protein ABIU63_14675 [Chitinophagaceae bacterium]